MGTRELKVVISGQVDGLKQSIRDVRNEFDGFGSGAKKLSEEFNKEFLIVGGAVAAGFGLAVKSAMDFDAEMSNVQAVSGATGDEMDLLRQAAIDAGAATVFSASQAAQAQSELAKAGVSTADILGGGLTGALDLASAGGLSLGDAAMYAANAMNTFGLSGSDVPRIADTLAAGANKSAAEIDDMGLALQQSGLVADQMGLSLEDTVGVLSLFAQAGMKGSDAGTSLKTALMRLTPQSEEAASMMEELGLQFFNTNGEFIGISASAELLQQKLGGLTQEQQQMALKTIFGADAIRSATLLMDAGAEGVDKWVGAVSDSGYAAELAGTKTDNLKGDLEALRGSIETALIEGGGQATDALRGVTQGLTSVVNGLGEMPAPLQTALLGMGALVGVGSASIGIYGTLAPKIAAFKEALEGMGGIGQSVASNLGKIGLAAGGVTAALGIAAFIYGKQAEAQAAFNAQVDKFTSAMKEAGGATDDFNKSIRQAFSDSKVGEILAKTNADLSIITRGVRESGTALDEWGQSAKASTGYYASGIQEAAQAGDEFAQELFRLVETQQISAKEYNELVGGLDTLNDQVDSASEKYAVNNAMLQGLTDTTGGAAGATDGLTGATKDAGGAFDTTAETIKNAVNALKEWYDQTTSQLSAQIGFEQSLDDITQSVLDNGTSLDINTDAGRKNIQSFIDAKNAAIDWGVEILNATGSTDQATFATLAMADSLAESMRQAGYSEDAVQQYLTTLGLTPDDISTQFNAPGLSGVDATAQHLKQNADNLDGRGVNLSVSASGLGGVSAQFQDLINKVDTLNQKGVGRIQTIIAGGGLPGANLYADGGSVADGWFVTGEQGIEVGYKSGSNVEIFSNGDTRRMLSSGGGGNVYNTVHIHMPAGSDGADVVNAIKRYERDNGTAWRN